MCKVAGVAKITDKNRDDVWLFMQMLGRIMSVGNKDGLGYAAIDKKGHIFGEKWLINDTAFQDLSAISEINSKNIKMLYDYFGGVINKDAAEAIILHTRAATCEKGIHNTHPFVNEKSTPKVAVIHNGMIYNDEDFTRKFSTCDSEVLAHLYTENNVSEDLGNLDKFTNKLEGWYTVLGLSKRNDGKLIMDAYTMNGRLASYYIPELETRVWSTDAEDIRKVARAFGMTVSDGKEMKPDTAMRIDVLTGEVIVTSMLKTRSIITVYPSLHIMEGNLDDERFRQKYFGDDENQGGWTPWGSDY